jgi:hypothetical protein
MPAKAGRKEGHKPQQANATGPSQEDESIQSVRKSRVGFLSWFPALVKAAGMQRLFSIIYKSLSLANLPSRLRSLQNEAAY